MSKTAFRPFLRIDDRLSLHLARPELAASVFQTIDAERTYLREWLPWVDATKKVTDTEEFMRESMAHNTAGSRLILFIMEDDKIAGSLSVVKFNRDNKSCEIGYWLREELQGRGIMTRACESLIQFLFRSKGMNRIGIHVASGNEKSRAIPHRLGFTREGCIRDGLFLYGTYHDLDLFSILKREWEATRKVG